MFPYWTSTIKPELLKVIKPVYLDKDHFAADLKAALKIEELIENRMVCSVLVDKKFSNIHGTLHGGAYAYLADLVSSMNIMTSNTGFKASVSLELNASYLKPALMNKKLYIASQILKSGKQTAVAEIKFYDERDYGSAYQLLGLTCGTRSEIESIWRMFCRD